MADRGQLDGEALIAALVTGGVEFIAIGGIAVVAHGYVRTTDDLDIVPAPEQQNLERLAAVLRGLDYEIFGGEEFRPDELVQPDLEGLLAGGSWVLITKHGGLDIIQLVEPDLDFRALDAEAITERVFGFEVRIAGYSHLVAMKEAAGRTQDVADLEHLRAVRGEDQQ